jgi:hypothetical protein
MAAQDERLLERRQELQQRLMRGTRAHQADTPDLAGERAEAGADFDVERVEERAADSGFVNTCRHAYRVERPQALACRRQEREPHGVEAGRKRVMVPLVPGPPRLESFLIDHQQRLAKRVHQ